ncbi:sigma-70 family RNA polymerase sigma factor [Clostridium sediminicola]|uniref:RNA polymerase sigma factor n=1 Tax=Clostridium sediminicola TaxID=3114879 RepID=UPI0031F26BAA
MKDESLENILINETKIIFKYLIKLGATKEDAEDIIQDTVCKAIIYIDSIDGDKIISWLFKVAINQYYSLYNKNKKYKNYGLELDNETLNKFATETLTVEHLLNKELGKYIGDTLDLLKPSYKNLLLLKYYMDLSYKEISKLLGLKESQIKTYLYRARNKFKKLWEESNYER